jgi:hypothetical protein
MAMSRLGSFTGGWKWEACMQPRRAAMSDGIVAIIALAATSRAAEAKSGTVIATHRSRPNLLSADNARFAAMRRHQDVVLL